MRMRAGNGIRSCTKLLVGAAALSLGCEVAKEASWKLRVTAEASSQTPSNAPPIPAAGLMAEAKSLRQEGLPVEATRAAFRADNPLSPAKIALGEESEVSLHRFEFSATDVAEVFQWIFTVHGPGLDLLRSQIRFRVGADDFSNNCLGGVEYIRRGAKTNAAQ
jgi:hypothetical protein